MKRFFFLVSLLVASPVMASHTHNQQIGAGELIGAAIGGLLGSQIGNGNGSKAATAAGVVVGMQVGRTIDQQQATPAPVRGQWVVLYPSNGGYYQPSTGWYGNQGVPDCEQYRWNSGAYSACLRGRAELEQEYQSQLEEEAYRIQSQLEEEAYRIGTGGFSSRGYRRNDRYRRDYRY